MRLIPVAKEGYPFIAASLFCIIIVWLVGLSWLEVLFVPLGVFVVAFFRDPERTPPADESSIVSPADGRIIKVEPVDDKKFTGAQATKISIFMNVFNVHVNRVPSDCRVKEVRYRPGKFFNASFDKASEFNEQNALIVESPHGCLFAFNQIAGLIARRIVCYAKPGDELKRGTRFGMIRFGSRVDVYLPASCRVSVRVGDRVSAGTTTLGYWNAG